MAIDKIPLGSHWASVTDLTERLRQARENRSAQNELLRSIEERIQRRRTDLEHSLSDLPAAQRTKIVSRSVAGFRAEQRRATADDRAAHVRIANGLRAKTQPAKVHYQSPVQMLMRAGLGTDRRSRILQQIERSGTAELGSLAEYAAATSDLELAAALCSRVSIIKASDRPFSRQELAESLVGDEFKRATVAIMEIDRHAEQALDEDGALERGQRNATNSIRFGLMRRREEAVGADLPQSEVT